VLKRSAARARPERIHSIHLAPPEGINVADKVTDLTKDDAMVMENLLRGEFGLVPRHGWKEVVAGIGGGVGIRQIIPYMGSKADGSKDRLFATTTVGIYSITTVATLVYSFGTQSSKSGYGTFVTTTTPADKFIAYTDEENGYILYDENADTWAAVVQGTGAGQLKGVNPALLCHVCAWKNRLFFTEKDSTRSWYLPVGVPTDNSTGATMFDFGPKFRYGGYLVGIWDWTMSAGFGPDSCVVAISSAGDVLIYQGSDPSYVSSFAISGTWYVGQVPTGVRHIATDVGGDLLILSSLGLLPLSHLIHGGEKLDPSLYASRKIAPLLNVALSGYSTQRGWDVRVNPVDACLMILQPSGLGFHWAMSLHGAKGWSRITNFPATCAESWKGGFYFGTSDGRVCQSINYVDGMHSDGSGASPVAWKYISAFSEMDSSRRKIVRLISPDFMTQGDAPSYGVDAVYNFDISDATLSEYQQISSGSFWDSGKWDTATWGSGVGIAGDNLGTAGVGSHIAIRMSGHSQSRTVIAGAQVFWETGGVL